ncbi:MAG: penicillin-binding protein activator [Myxococcota bacterium]
MTSPSPLRSFGAALFVAAALLVVPAAHAGKKHTSPDVVEDALAFATTDRDRAIRLLEETIDEDPNAADVAVLMVHAGEQRRLAGNPAEARKWFVKVVTGGVPGAELESAKLGLTLLDARDALDGRVLSALAAAPEKDVLATQNADRYLMLAIDAAKKNDDRSVGGFAKKAIAFSREDPAVSKRINTTLSSLAGTGAPAVDPVMGGQTPVERAEALYKSGDFTEARTAAQDALVTAEGPDRDRMSGMIRTIDAGAATGKIAVLLPLSGKYEAVGAQVKDALSYGYGGGSKQLVFLDTGATAEGAVAAIEKAVLTEHAIAVVGPLLTDETDLVIRAAENLHVPLLSLSQSYEATAGNYWSLQGMYTRVDQIDALLEYAMGAERAMKNFAIFAPDNPFGNHAAELFRKAVEARGGSITTEARYSAEETNLLPYAKKLGTRTGDIGSLRAAAKAQGGNPDTVVLPPQLDFDGIFIPDTAARTPLACAALAFEEFPMGDFTPTRGMKKIPLLGLSGWNTPNLVATGNEYTRNSLFADVFSATVVGEADPFVTAFKAAYGRTPSALEAATVDAGRLLAVAARSPATTRPAFRDALLAATIDDAVTGATKFDPATLRAARTMVILTITRSSLDDLATVNVD